MAQWETPVLEIPLELCIHIPLQLFLGTKVEFVETSIASYFDNTKAWGNHPKCSPVRLKGG